MVLYFLAAISYAISIFIDVSVYHLKYRIQDNRNIRYLLSLINIFQYSARAFVLLFMPVMAFVTESLKDKLLVWNITFLSHFLVVVFLIPLLYNRFSINFSIKVVQILNYIFGKSKNINLTQLVQKELFTDEKYKFNSENISFFSVTFIAGFLFSISITFLYYLSFSFPQKALMLSSFTQIINMFGSLILILFIDPKIMSNIDQEEGFREIMLLTISRILVHVCLMLILFFIR